MEQQKYNPKHIASLAKLKLNEFERKMISKEFESIVAFADHISAVKIEQVNDNCRIETAEDKLREDRIETRWMRDELMRNAPTAEDGYLVVPCMMDDI